MTQRINPFQAGPKAIGAMLKLEHYIQNTGLEHSLVELVRIRASQINGCGYCLHMHCRDARAAGETPERLDLLVAWRESSLYTPREQAALAWTESLTLVAERGAPDADYQQISDQFSEAEMMDLTLLIGSINIWNRINVGFHTPHPVESAEVRQTAAQ